MTLTALCPSRPKEKVLLSTRGTIIWTHLKRPLWTLIVVGIKRSLITKDLKVERKELNEFELGTKEESQEVISTQTGKVICLLRGVCQETTFCLKILDLEVTTKSRIHFLSFIN